jgi:hypothetical protein
METDRTDPQPEHLTTPGVIQQLLSPKPTGARGREKAAERATDKTEPQPEHLTTLGVIQQLLGPKPMRKGARVGKKLRKWQRMEPSHNRSI